MGIYQEITNDLGVAFDTDLKDAVIQVILVHTDRVNNTFDPITRTYPQNSVSGSVRGVRVALSADELTELGVEVASFSFMYLDAEKPITVPIIEPNDFIIIDNERFQTSIVAHDPAGATWTLICTGKI